MRKEVKIGILGIVALGMLFFGINYLKGVQMFKASNYYYVEFSNVNGLAQSSPVFASGYKVGIVTDLQYNFAKPGYVVAEIEVDNSLKVPKGTTSELVTEMLGTVKMNLNLNLGGKEFCQRGDTLQGIVNKGLMSAAESMMPKVEQLLPKMDSILTSLNTLLANPAIAKTLENAEKITGNLDITTRELNKLMKNELPQLTGKLNHIADNFCTISENLKGIDYAGTMQKVDATLSNVAALTGKLNSKDNTLGLLFNDPTLYQNLSTTTANAASLLEDLQAHPKRYVHFSLFGRKDKSEKK